MREIKFRAFVRKFKPEGEMYTDLYSIHNRQNAPVSFEVSSPEYERTVVFIGEESSELMQFTGLKDKNGKEIYEGDIVAWSEDIHAHGEYLGQEHNKSEVAYGGSSFWVRSSVRLDDIDDGDGIACEVIGNVHEHPELLQSPTHTEKK